MIGSRVRPPLYTPRLPIGGGGGVFQPGGGTPYKPSAGAGAIGGLAQMFSSYQQGKQQRKQQDMQSLKTMMEMGQLDPTVYQSPEFQNLVKRLKLPGIMPGQTPPMGIDELMNAPEGFELGSFGIDPQTGQVRTPRYGRPDTGKEKTSADIWKEITNLKKAQEYTAIGSEQDLLIENQIAKLNKELAGLQEVEIEEVRRGTPAKESWLPFGIGDVPEVPPTKRLVRKKEQPPIAPPGLESLAKKKFEAEAPDKAARLKTRQEHLAEYKRLGGGKTKAGRSYADKYLQ